MELTTDVQEFSVVLPKSGHRLQLKKVIKQETLGLDEGAKHKAAAPVAVEDQPVQAAVEEDELSQVSIHPSSPSVNIIYAVVRILLSKLLCY